MIRLTTSIRDQLFAHALRGLPNEACGLFAGESGTADVSVFYPMRNAAASSTIYQLDGQEMLDIEQAADSAGLQLLGVMHSHTHTSDYPSATDISDAARFDPFGAFHFVIVSLREEQPTLRSYRLAAGKSIEEPIEVVETFEDPGLPVGEGNAAAVRQI